MICGSGGSKSRLAKAAGAEPAGQMRDEKVHAVVARSTFPKPMNGPLNLPGPLELRQFSIPSGHLSASNNWRHGWEIWPPLHSRADCPIDRLPLQKSNYLATCLIRTKPLTTLLSLYLLIGGNVSTCCCQNFVFNSDPL